MQNYYHHDSQRCEWQIFYVESAPNNNEWCPVLLAKVSFYEGPQHKMSNIIPLSLSELGCCVNHAIPGEFSSIGWID